MEESRLNQTMLLDFYGELLPEKQKVCFELHCNDDLTITEIAEQMGISRQAAWDNIRRAEAALLEYEAKTGLLTRFMEIRHGLQYIKERAELIIQTCDSSSEEVAKEIINEVLRISNRG